MARYEPERLKFELTVKVKAVPRLLERNGTPWNGSEKWPRFSTSFHRLGPNFDGFSLPPHPLKGCWGVGKKRTGIRRFGLDSLNPNGFYFSFLGDDPIAVTRPFSISYQTVSPSLTQTAAHRPRSVQSANSGFSLSHVEFSF